jgi:hypothetical protein
MVAQLGRRRAVKRPGPVFAPADRARPNQVAHRGGHGRAVRPDQVGQPLMRQRQSHSNALRSNTPPALSQVPEGQQQPIIDARVMGDRQGNRQRVRAPGGTAEQLHTELRPRRYACHQTVVEHGQTRRLEHHPAHLGLDVGAVSVPTPGAHDIARTQQLDAPAPEHIDLPREQPVDDQEAAMMRVRLDRARGVPIARGETAYAGQRLAVRALALRFVEQRGEVGVGIDNADQIPYRAHVRSAAQENDHKDEKHDYQARPGQRPAASPELGLRTIAGVAALWWLADPVLFVVIASHLRDSTLNRRAGYPHRARRGAAHGNQTGGAPTAGGAISYVVGSDTVTLDSWMVNVPLLARW